jgi:hypothetical protein
LELFRVFAQRQHCLAAIFVADASAVLQGIDPAKAGLAAGLRGPVECWAFWRAAASNAGVSWGDLRKDMVPPGSGCWDSEERTSPRVRLFTLVGYHSGGALSSDNVSIRQLTDLGQDFFD